MHLDTHDIMSADVTFLNKFNYGLVLLNKKSD